MWQLTTSTSLTTPLITIMHVYPPQVLIISFSCHYHYLISALHCQKSILVVVCFSFCNSATATNYRHPTRVGRAVEFKVHVAKINNQVTCAR